MGGRKPKAEKRELITLYEFTTTPMPPSGSPLAPDTAAPVPEGVVSVGKWEPLSAVPMPTQRGMGVMVVWQRAVVAPKQEAQEIEARPGSRVAVPTAAEKAKLGVLS